MASFFDQKTYESLQMRLEKIAPETPPQWGKMNAGQMLHHCQEPIKIALDKSEVVMKPNWFIKLLFKKMLYSPKPFKKNAPTPPQFRSTGEVDFQKEKAALQEWMEELWNDRDNSNRTPHPIFGAFTKEQWGILQWKHLNHHFEQFGV